MSESMGGQRISAYALSDVGQVRQQNEDSLYRGTTVFAVADGMGGHQAGEVASETALEPLRELDGREFRSAKEVERALTEAIAAANRTVVDKAAAEPDYRGMGTTLTAALVRDGRIHVAHVGDSRAYLLRPGDGISQLTTDHTVVEQLIRDGQLSRDEASTHPQRSVITRAIGVERDIEVDSLPPLELRPGDQLLLCSDGLTGPVSDDVITEILESTPDGDAACQALLDAANDAGGPDNITVVLVRAEGEPQAASAAAAAANGDGAGPDTPDADTEPLTPSPGSVKQIRTRQESGQDWASSMGRYGAPQGANRSRRSRRRARESSGRGRRVLAGLLAVVVLLAVIGGGGYLLLSRAFFVGDREGTVAIYNGVPQEVAGVALYWVAEETDLQTDELPFRLQNRVREGVTVGTLGEGRRLVSTYRADVEEAGAADTDEQPPDQADPADEGADPADPDADAPDPEAPDADAPDS